MLKRAVVAGSLLFAVSAPGRAQPVAEDARVAAALRVLEVWLEAQQAYEDIPGLSMAVVHDQQLLWSGAFGHANRARKIPATQTTIYSICSISKLFTSIAVMQLRDRGRLRLDDPVEEHLTWFGVQRSHPHSPPVTIRGLLTHSSGLPRESDFPYWTGPGFEFPTRHQVIERIADQQTLYPADRYFQYSNLGMTLAGEIVAAASGVPYAEYVERNILEPLGLDDTSPEIPNDAARLATGYGARGRDGDRNPLTPLQVRGIAPAAGYASTVEDLARFASWQLRLLGGEGEGEGGKKVLSANTLREMHRVHWVDPDWQVHWGLGFSVWRTDDKTFVGHGGSCPGYRSSLILRPEEKFAAVFMSNAIDVNSGKYTRGAYSLLGPAIETALKSPGEGESGDPELERYAGTYETAWGGELAVITWEGDLAILRLPTDEPRESIMRLRRVAGNVFRRVRSDDSLGEEIVFDLDASGNVVRFKRHSNYFAKRR